MDPKTKSVLTHFICIITVMAAAFLVRLPSAYIRNVSPEVRAAYTDVNGMPYLSEMDSYYHVRLADRYVEYGDFGEDVSEDGTDWDTKSFWPEGRSAEYEPGIIVVTAAVYRIVHALTGTGLPAVEYCLAAVMSVLAALAAYMAGFRMSGKAGGFVGGILVSCTSGFVARTVFGRYDTDMFVVLMDVLTVLFLAEALRARQIRRQAVFSACFALTGLLYTLCWDAANAVLFSLAALGGGAVYAAAALFLRGQNEKNDETAGRGARLAPLRTLLMSTVMLFAVLVLKHGLSFLTEVVHAVIRSADITASDGMPNVVVSISELKVPEIFPKKIISWFAGYVPGERITVVNGIGGIAIAVLSLAALAWLLVCAVGKRGGTEEGTYDGIPLSRRECAMYFCVLGVLFLGGVYAVGRGIRFIEHLSVPAGLLAGGFIGWFAHGMDHDVISLKNGKAVMAVIVSIAAVVPAVSGSLTYCRAVRPGVSDASADAMHWISENAQSGDAVIAGWWDYGYFYESESGHPCLWDGGSTDGARAVMIGKALTADSRELSALILKMLAGSGNRPVDFLLAHTDAGTAFDTIWKALPLDQDSAGQLLSEQCGLTEAEAREAEELLHPAAPQESYLVLTGRLLTINGWFEYFADWDFRTGTAASPGDGTAQNGSAGQNGTEKSPEERRAAQTLRKLYNDKEADGWFTPVFEADDGIEHIQVWRIE